MTVGKGYAPLGKSKVIATPDANKNNKPVAVNKDKKDTNPVAGTGAANDLSLGSDAPERD